MRRIPESRSGQALEMLVLVTQTLFYTAGIVVFVHLVLFGYASNERMQASSDRMQKEHERIMLMTESTLREILKR